MTEQTQQQWKHAVAGCTAGLVSVLALHPLDVVKTRLQVQDGAARGALPLYRGTVDAVRVMIQQEGWRSLYGGLSPALLGAGLSWGIYFFAYNRAKERYQRLLQQTKLSPQLHLLSAAEAGSLVCFITNPIWVIKTRLELQHASVTMRRSIQAPAAGLAGGSHAAGGGGFRTATATAAAEANAASSAAAASGARLSALGVASSRAPSAATVRRVMLAPYRNMVHAVREIAREEGFRGFYRGIAPSLLLVSHGAIQFMVYEELKSLAGGWGRGGQPDSRGQREVSSPEIIGMGALSKLAATVITYPSQVVRSRLQQRMQHRAIRYKSGMDVLRITLRREGWRGLYKGIVPNVLRVMPQSALTFLVYETVMRNLTAFEAKRPVIS